MNDPNPARWPIIDVMRGQFQVWNGTENSEEILRDTALAIGNRVLGLKGPDLTKFADDCKSPLP